MRNNDAYADIVQLYEVEHADFTDDIELLLELSALGQGPILELGCGTGRVLLPLAKAGYEIVGIDSSQPMLDVARNRAEGSDIHLIRGDMATMDTIDSASFGMIIASLNSVMHLTTSNRQRTMLESAWRSLQPGGRLVVDTLNPSIGQLNHLLNTTHHEGNWTSEDGVTIDKWGHRKHGDAPQIIDTLIWYDQLSATGEYRRVRTQFELRYLHQSELELMFELAGFRHIDWYGSYELDEWHADSDRTIAIAHKDDK